MTKFKFKMDFLIKLRQQKEEQAMMKLAKRLASIRKLEGQIYELETKKSGLISALSELTKSGKLTGPLFVLYKNYQQVLNKEIDRNEELLFLSRREEAKDRAALIKAATDRQVIEKLKERKFEEHKFSQEAEAQNILEELAALGKARREREDGRPIDF